jgi:hypothetical protein
MSGYRGFQCPGSHDLENSDLPMAYLPHSFCRSDGCRPFGKFEWDPTVTGSLSSFSSANSCILSFALRAFSSMLFLLSFHVRIPKGFYPSYPAISTVVLAINDKHTLLVKLCQQSPPLALMATTTPEFFSPPLTSMSKKRHAPPELLQ